MAKSLRKRAASALQGFLDANLTIEHGDRRAARFSAFGAGSIVFAPQGALFNEHEISIGEATLIGPYSSISVGMAPGQQMATHPVLSIGSRCVIGRGSHIVAHFAVEIGDDVQTGPYVYITDQNHSYEDPTAPIGVQWPREAPVVIGAESWLGANVVVLPGARIGRHVTVGAGSVVRGDLPDHCVAVGVPARVVRKKVDDESWPRIATP